MNNKKIIIISVIAVIIIGAAAFIYLRLPESAPRVDTHNPVTETVNNQASSTATTTKNIETVPYPLSIVTSDPAQIPDTVLPISSSTVLIDGNMINGIVSPSANTYDPNAWVPTEKPNILVNTSTGATAYRDASFEPAKDPDGDGLTNSIELMWNTDPNNPDTNNDGISDGDSVKKGINPLTGKALPPTEEKKK